MSIEICDVDKLETYTHRDLSLSVDEFVSKTIKSRSEYFLLTPEGLMIDLSKPVQNISSIVYLFCKNSVITSCEIPLSPKEKFLRDPVYTQPINFDNYHRFHEPYSEIPRVESSLFDNYKKAIDTFANFMIKKESFQRAKDLFRIRFGASRAFISYFEQYVRQQKSDFDEFKEEAQKLDVIIAELTLKFRDSIARLRNTLLPEEVKEVVETSLRGYGSTISEKSRKIKEKLKKIEKNLNEAEDIIFEARMSLDSSTATIGRDIDFIQNKDSFNTNLSDLTNVINDYNEFRDLFTRAEQAISERPPTESRDSLAKSMLNMKSKADNGRATTASYISMFDSFKDIFKRLDVTPKRVEISYKDKVIEPIVKKTQIIKYSCSDKITYLKKKLKKLNELKDFLTVPNNLEAACNAANDEEKRSQLKIMEIQKLYFHMCQWIVKDYSERKDFLQKFGMILPKDICASLTSPVINRSYLRQLVKIQPCEEQPEAKVKQLPKDELIAYYEGRLSSLEKNYSIEVNSLKNKEKKLQDHYVYLLKYKEKVTKEVKNQEVLLKKYLEQLAECRSKSFSETYARKFQNEVDKLKEKEKVFKAIHLLNLKDLVNENDFLKSGKDFYR